MLVLARAIPECRHILFRKKCQKGQTSTARTAWGIDQSEDHLTDIYGSPQSHGTAMPFPLAGASLVCVWKIKRAMIYGNS